MTSKADDTLMWFLIGVLLTLGAAAEFGWGLTVSKPLDVLLAGGFGGFFTGLVLSLTIKLWIDSLAKETKQE